MIKLIDILKEVERQPLTYEEFIEKINKELVPYKGGYGVKGEFYNKVIAAIKGKTSKVDVITALKDLEKTSRSAALSSLIGKCMNDFKQEEPRWDFSKMKTIRK